MYSGNTYEIFLPQSDWSVVKVVLGKSYYTSGEFTETFVIKKKKKEQRKKEKVLSFPKCFPKISFPETFIVLFI